MFMARSKGKRNRNMLYGAARLGRQKSMKTSILIVDDEQSARDFCSEILKGMGFGVGFAESGARALEILEKGPKDIVLSDVRMPEMSGIELLKVIKLKYPETDVVIMTGYGTIPDSVEVIKLGAYDYITKPFSVEDFKHKFQHLAEKRKLLVENRLLREQLGSGREFAGLVGTSAGMREIYPLILRAAKGGHPVLILGESGTGKELVARAIHACSPRKNKPFVTIDCGALSPTLIESELFGHARGAFTGANSARQGLLASARDGTIFLDEVAELPVALQSKLLRALQEHEVKVIGVNQWTRFEGRIIAATNQNIQAALEEGTLRKDLYFRLNVLSIVLPPLRERKGDIPVLVHEFLQRHGGSESRIKGISADALNRLINYNWPGNVRELENCVYRAIALGAGPLLEVKDLPSPLSIKNQMVWDGEKLIPLKESEKNIIFKTLKATGGDRVRAAKILGIGKTTIYRKLKSYDLKAS